MKDQFNTVIFFLLILNCFVFLLTPDIFAQPSLNIKRMSVNWPQVTISFQAKCGAAPKYDLSENNFIIKENGRTIDQFTVSCCPPDTHCCISTALVAARNQEMGDTALYRAKLGMNIFADSLVTNCDESLLVTYNSDSATLKVPMTFDKSTLKIGINSIVLSGMYQVKDFDAIMIGLEELVNKGNQLSKALIIIFQGADIYYAYKIMTIARPYAIQNNIRIFTLCLGNCMDAGEWWSLPEDTGGKPYNVGSIAQVIAAYQDIFNILSHHFYECEIQYTAACPDGKWRNVDITLKQVSGCPGSNSQRLAYQAPLDSTKFNPINFSLGSETVQTNNEVIIPFNLDTPIDGPMYPSSYDLTFNKQKLTFVNVVKTGFLWNNKSVDWSSTANGVQINLKDTVWLNGNGILCGLKFKANDLLNDDADTIKTTSTSYISPCTIAQFQNGIITIIAAHPKLDSCSITSPDNVVFDFGSRTYTPSPIPVDVSVTNTGKLEAKNLKAEVQFDNTVFHLVTGSNPQDMNPNVLPPNNTASAHWDLEPLPRMKKITSSVTVNITSDNHTPVVCTKNITIDSIPPILQIQLDPIVIRYNRDNVSYSPMPFPLVAHVTNIGMAVSKNTKAEIILPSGLSLDSSEQNKTIKFLYPIHLPNLVEGISTWYLTHPVTLEEQRYTITVRSWSDNADQVEATIDIIIPAAEGPMLTCDSWSVPSLIHFDSLTRSYTPNPFTIKYSAINTGGFDLDSARATIILPQGFVLDPPTQNITQYFNPMKIARWKSQLPSNTVSWQVKTLPRYDSTQDIIQIEINGINSFNQGNEEYVCSSNIAVDAFGKTKINCSVSGVDSILYSRMNGLTPNPFTIDFTLTNESSLPVTIQQVNLRHSIQGLNVESMTPLVTDSVLISGASLQIKAKMRAAEMKAIRTGDITLDYTTKESVQEMIACTKNIFIDSIMTSAIGSYVFTTELIDSIRYNCKYEKYIPDVMTAKASVSNVGDKTIDSLQIKLQLPNILLLINPADSIKNVPTIATQSTQDIEWQLRVARYIQLDTTVIVRFELMRSGQLLSLKEENLFVAGITKPAVIVSGTKLNYQFSEGDTTTKQTQVQIKSSDNKKYLWEAYTFEPWVSVNPSKGETNDYATVKVDGSKLKTGTYKTSVLFGITENCASANVKLECVVSPKTEIKNITEPRSFTLGQNYPNPFTTQTAITLTPSLSQWERVSEGRVRVSFKVYDIFGREVLDLSDRIDNPPSADKLTIDNFQLPAPGIYIYRLTIGHESQARMMIVVK